MAISHARIEVSTATPTLLTVEGTESATSVTLQVQNLGAGAMYLGGAGVSGISYGIALVPGSAVTLDRLSARDEIYAVAQNPGEFVALLRVSR
jgi:hypothetical protein